MNPDRSNYEHWALDYLEGTLDASRRESFERFLAAHADLAEEIRSLVPLPVLPVERIEYPDTQALLRGGRRVALRRAGSLLSGAAAASLIVGLFVVADRTLSQGRQMLMSQRIELTEEQMPIMDLQAEASDEQEVSPAVVTALRTETPIVRRSSGLSESCADASSSVVEISETSFRPVAEMPVAPVLDEGLTRRIEIRGAADRPVAPAVPTLSVPREAFVVASENGRRSLRELRSGVRAADAGETMRAGNAETRSALSSLLAPLDYIIPIKTYRTENESGIEIASLIRIGNRKID